MTTYITVAIPYVNAEPHVGYAFELVDADLAARARRLLGDDVRFLGGTDEYSLKNVLAAEADGRPIEEFVADRAVRFTQLAERLGISFDDFIRTSSDPRHRPAVARLWRACAAAGDLYEREYEGSYCVGCEQFYAPAELVGGACPEHGTPAQRVAETNWFFGLSRYQRQLEELIASGRLLVEPASYRNEVLAFIRRGLEDISVSRSAGRARGWGVPVPDDPGQVVYVWFDALVNYISALDYGVDGEAYDRWWRHADERVHVVGKGITRFHAVFWPAFLLSAGEPAPTHVHVHPYLTTGGRKIAKSAGNHITPVDLIDRYGADALRWWLASEPALATDTDFTVDGVVDRSDADLANGIGNLVRRITSLIERCTPAPRSASGTPLPGSVDLPGRTARALARFDRRAAIAGITAAIQETNRDLEAREPWKLVKDSSASTELRELLGGYHATLQRIVDAVRPLVPELADRARDHLDLRPDRQTVQDRLAPGSSSHAAEPLDPVSHPREEPPHHSITSPEPLSRTPCRGGSTDSSRR